MEKLYFDRKVKCDWCGQTEICSITHYGTTNYNRLICLECAMSINGNDRVLRGEPSFDLNNSNIIFKDLVVDITKKENKVEDFIIENTGGNVNVAWGSLEDGRYFALGCEVLNIYDKDEYEAMNEEDYDGGYEWQLKHTLESYSFEMDEYKEIQKQLYERCSEYEKRCDIFYEYED